MVDLVNILLHAILLFSINVVIVPFIVSAILDFFFSLLIFQMHVLDHDYITLESKIVDFVFILLKLCQFITILAIVPLYSMSAIMEFFEMFFFHCHYVA